MRCRSGAMNNNTVLKSYENAHSLLVAKHYSHCSDRVNWSSRGAMEHEIRFGLTFTGGFTQSDPLLVPFIPFSRSY